MQNINIGNAPNDGTGDVLRQSFNISNLNDQELNANKVDKITGKGLSTEDFTTAEKEKLALLTFVQTPFTTGETGTVGAIKGIYTGSTTSANFNYTFALGLNAVANAPEVNVLGSNITGSTSATTYVDRLNIKRLATTGLTQNLGLDANNNVVIGVFDNPLKEDKINKQNSFTPYDGTATKYPSFDLTNAAFINSAKLNSQTGFVYVTDQMELSALTSTVLRIKETTLNGVYFSQAYGSPTATYNDAFKTFPQTDYPLSQLITATGTNVNVSGLTVDGLYVRYVGYNVNGGIVSSPTTFKNNPTVAQLGYIAVQKSGSTVSFVGGIATGGVNVFTQPYLASSNALQLDTVRLITNILIGLNPGTSLSNSAGVILGASINWHQGPNNPNNTNSINERSIQSATDLPFYSIDVTTSTATTIPTVLTSWTQTVNGIAVRDSFYNTTTGQRDTLANNEYSVKQLILSQAGRFYLKEGSHPNNLGYATMDIAKAAVATHVFPINLLPVGTNVEIGRICFKKGFTDTTDVTQFVYFPTATGGGAGNSSVQTVADATTSTKGIIQLSGDISGTATNVIVTRVNNGTPYVSLGTGLLKNTTGSGQHSIAIPDNDYATTGFVNSKITQVITNGNTGQTPSADAVFDALSGKQDTIVGNPITGQGIGTGGTAGYLARFTGTTSIGNSAIYQASNGYLSVGRTAPSSQFEIYNGLDAVYQRIIGVSDGDNYGALELWDTIASSKWQFAHKSIAGQAKDFAFMHWNGTSWSNVMQLKDNGFVGIGTFSPSNKLTVAGNIAANLYIKSGGTASQFLMADGSVSTGITNTTTGSGTANFVSKWSNTSGLTNSIVFDNGTNVGIGTSSPSQVLDVNGAIRSNTSTIVGNNILGLYADNTSIAPFSGLFILNNGNVGVGTNFPGEKLSVDGNILASSFIKVDGTSSQFLMADGSVQNISNPVSGNGTANRITKWSSTSGLTNSNLSDNGSSITTSVPLSVNGSVSAGSFIKSGATVTNILLAGGTDMPRSSFADSSLNINTTAPLQGGGNLTTDRTLSITQAGASTNGYLSSTDWNTFNNKLSTISGIVAGGELAGTYPNPTLVNASVIGKVLTGYVSGVGTVSATDSILQAIQKLNGNDGLKADKTTAINTTAPLTGGGDLSTNRTLAITQAGASTNGYLSSTDWNTFNNKQNGLKYYAEPTATPTTAPVTTGVNSIALGDSSQANSNEMFVYGRMAGDSSTNTPNSIFIGENAGRNASNSGQITCVGFQAGYGSSSSPNSNFYGFNSGLQASNSTGSNFMGTGAGYQASNSSYTNFFGFDAGAFSNNSTSSNFFGFGAGMNAQTASYSNFFGYNAGKGLTFGNNNIVIGSNITLPSGSVDRINIGGLIFGFGTYSNTINEPSTSASGGRIVINNATDNLVDTLQVNGSMVATAIKKSGGLPNQFLMADGSVTTAGSGIAGSGTPNLIAKWNTSNTLTNSIINDNGTNVTVGSATDWGYKLAIDGGSLYIRNSGGLAIVNMSNGSGNFYFGKDNPSGSNFGIPNGNVIYDEGANPFVFSNSATERMRITPSGNMLIGTPTDNGNRLQVNGSAWFNGGLDVLGTILPRATEAIRIINDSGYISAFNTANSTRNGFIQFNTGESVYQSETGSKLIKLNPSGGNVLIGTNSDNGTKLQVNGGVTLPYEQFLSNLIAIPSGAQRWVKLFTTSNENYLSSRIDGNMTSNSSVQSFSIEIRGAFYDMATAPNAETRPFVELTTETYADRLVKIMVIKEGAVHAIYVLIDASDQNVELFWNLDSSDRFNPLVHNSLTSPANDNNAFIVPAQSVKANNRGITVKNNGFVGIGTTNPASKLVVAGGKMDVVNTNAQLSVLNENGHGVRLAACSGANTFAGGTVAGDSVLVAEQRLFLVAGNSGDASKNVVLNPNGNLLVGTTTDDTANRLQVVGNVNVTGTITASLGFFNSDLRLKEILSRNGDIVKFRWNDQRDDKTHIGVIAQEVQEVYPDMVNEGADGMLSVNYIELLLQKMSDMEKEIKELKSKLNN